MGLARWGLPFPGGCAPDGTAGNIPAVWTKKFSTGTPPLNAPKLAYYQLEFDPATDWHWEWQLPLVDFLASQTTCTLRFSFGCTSTVGNIVWKGGLRIITYNNLDLDSAAFHTVDTTTMAAPSPVVGSVKTVGLDVPVPTLTDTPHMAVVFLGRDADNGGDTCDTGTAWVTAGFFEYTTP